MSLQGLSGISGLRITSFDGVKLSPARLGSRQKYAIASQRPRLFDFFLDRIDGPKPYAGTFGYQPNNPTFGGYGAEI